MTDPRRYPDPLHVPGDEPTRQRLQKAYEAGVADGHRIHVLALVLMIGLGFVIGFALASGVRAAASRSGLQSGDSFSAGRSEAPSVRTPELDGSDTGGASLSGPSAVPPPLAAPEPADLDDGGGISSALSRGWATFCRPTATRCQSWGGGALLGAVPSFRYGDKPYTVVVWHGSRHVAVRVVSYCACGNRAGSPTVIDLSPAAFMRLAPLSEGVIEVTIEAGGPSVTVPPTDVSP